MRKKLLSFSGIGLLAFSLILSGCAGNNNKKSNTDSSSPSAPVESKFPAGKLVIYGYGQPQFLAQFYNSWLTRNNDIAPDVTIDVIQTEGEADARQKVVTSFASGAYNELPDVIQTAPISMIDMAEGGILMDLTDYMAPLEDQFVDGALDQLKYKGKIYGLPDSVRPQLLFYNKKIFDQYGIDPAEMDTVEGYIEVGRKLKEASKGKVYLSYVDPGSLTWRYYGRRGFMPQAGAKIWDDQGNVVIDTDPGAKLALGTIKTLVNEGLLLKSDIMKPPLYDATRNQEVATYGIGAFWDEFLRKNVSDMAGDWRVMPAPMYKDVQKRGAPVTSMFSLIKKPDADYAELFKKIWYDFHFDAKERQVWTESMESQNAPYANPITKSLLADEFWKAPSPFYGGQSFREMEGKALENGATNLRITTSDAEADLIISAELEKFIAGAQSMDEAIANMGKNLRAKIGQATPVE